jgi:hypothetical protein
MGSASAYGSGVLKTKPCESSVHPLGEGDLDFKFVPAGRQFHLRANDEAHTAYGGLVAWPEQGKGKRPCFLIKSKLPEFTFAAFLRKLPTLLPLHHPRSGRFQA